MSKESETPIFDSSAKDQGGKMSRLQRVTKMSAIMHKTLTQLTQQVRHRTTSEHLLGMRYQEKSGGFKSENQVAKENLCHMDYMPVPEGPWGENFRARNMKWTTMLIFASSALGITIYCMCVMNIFYLHTLPSRRRILPDVEKIGKIRPIECDEDDEEEM